MTHTREELDALHGRATPGTWLLADSEMPDEGWICVRLTLDDARFTDAAHLAWPAVSAELAAKDARIAALEKRAADAEAERDAAKAEIAQVVALSEQEPACTDCDDTGFAFQTERFCTCSQGLWKRGLSDGR